MSDNSEAIQFVFGLIQIITLIVVAIYYNGKTIGEIYLTNLIAVVIITQIIIMAIFIGIILVIIYIIS